MNRRPTPSVCREFLVLLKLAGNAVHREMGVLIPGSRPGQDSAFLTSSQVMLLLAWVLCSEWLSVSQEDACWMGHAAPALSPVGTPVPHCLTVTSKYSVQGWVWESGAGGLP